MHLKSQKRIAYAFSSFLRYSSNQLQAFRFPLISFQASIINLNLRNTKHRDRIGSVWQFSLTYKSTSWGSNWQGILQWYQNLLSKCLTKCQTIVFENDLMFHEVITSWGYYKNHTWAHQCSSKIIPLTFKALFEFEAFHIAHWLQITIWPNADFTLRSRFRTIVWDANLVSATYKQVDNMTSNIKQSYKQEIW